MLAACGSSRATEEFDTPEAERIAVLFGRRPAGVACPLAHFACPFGKSHVAVVRVEDRPGSGDVLAFRFLVLARELYQHLGDPFAIADRYPPDWNATGTLPLLAWPAEPLAGTHARTARPDSEDTAIRACCSAQYRHSWTAIACC